MPTPKDHYFESVGLFSCDKECTSEIHLNKKVQRLTRASLKRHTQSTTSIGYGDQWQFSIRCKLWLFIQKVMEQKGKTMFFGSKVNP